MYKIYRCSWNLINLIAERVPNRAPDVVRVAHGVKDLGAGHPDRRDAQERGALPLDAAHASFDRAAARAVRNRRRRLGGLLCIRPLRLKQCSCLTPRQTPRHSRRLQITRSLSIARRAYSILLFLRCTHIE